MSDDDLHLQMDVTLRTKRLGASGHEIRQFIKAMKGGMVLVQKSNADGSNAQALCPPTADFEWVLATLSKR